MKCPYQTKVIHKPEYIDEYTYAKHFAEDVTEFCECVKSECPFYHAEYTDGYAKHVKERCRKAERETEE